MGGNLKATRGDRVSPWTLEKRILYPSCFSYTKMRSRFPFDLNLELIKNSCG